MSNIRIDIASEFKDKGFKKAQTATQKLNTNLLRLGKTIVTVFAAREIVQFTKTSVKAFAEEDRAIRSLATSMDNLGLAFEGANIEGFIGDLQRTVAVSDGQLRPAFQGLVNATLDVKKSQELLALALDISAATGKDLTAVTNGLSRAYLKDLSALSRLNIGLTSAQLSTMTFAEAQAALTDRFGGQAAAAADSYQGKINALTIAFDEAQEVVGQKFIRALEILGDGDFEKVVEGIATAADKVANAFIRASYGVQKLKALLKGDFDQIAKLQESMNIELAGFGTKLGAAGAVQKMAQQLKLQKQIVSERKKAAAIAEKEKKNQDALNKAKAMFDLEKIQIEAALQGKITDEERTRLLLMKAILNEDAETATELTAKLKQMQAETMKLAYMLTSFPKANDPFQDWFKTLERLNQELAKILSMTLPQTMAAKTGGSAGNAALALGDAYAAQGTGLNASADAILAIDAANAAIANATTPEELAAAEDFLAGANAALDAANEILESAAALTLAAAGAEMLASADVLGESVFGAMQAGVPMTEIYVNVEGSVISAEDLAETITDIQYQYQKSGKGLLFSSTAI